jgi:phage terminase large subunit-like protein
MICCTEALGPARFAGWDADGYPQGKRVTSPFIRIVATEEGQAGDVYGAVEYMLKYGAVRDHFPGLDVGITRTMLPDGGKIAAVSSKAASKDGGKESFVVFDETHLYILPELKQTHSTVRRNLAKRKMAEPWSLETSTMYAPGEDSIAEGTHNYARLIENGKIRDDGGLLFDHREGPRKFNFDDDEELTAALAAAYGAASEWMDFTRLLDEARDAQTNKADFLRYFVNIPTKREATLFIKSDRWDSCAREGMVIPLGSEICLGADGSRTFDTTVVARAHKTDEGEIWVEAKVFSVRAEVAHHVLHEGGRIDFNDVEGEFLDSFTDYKVLEAAYDPRYLERSADILDARLHAAALVPVEPSSRNMREALETLERTILGNLLRHNGDPVLAAHFANCAVQRAESAQKEIRRVRQIDQRKPIDVVPALALAVWRAVNSEVNMEPLVAWA